MRDVQHEMKVPLMSDKQHQLDYRDNTGDEACLDVESNKPVYGPHRVSIPRILLVILEL